MDKVDKADSIIKMAPCVKDYIWGGTRLKDKFNKKSDDLIIAESWELSAYPGGESIIASGKYAGKTFPEYLESSGKEILGKALQQVRKFPIIIKFLDANKPLSIQVHPTNEYALKVEGEYGKSEMWYIIDALPDAFIYYGFSELVTKEELRRRIKDNTLTQILNRVNVKKGETYFVQAGMIHAVGSGVLACEVQENSDLTYRIYDYDRTDNEGHLRELHIDKAIDVIDIELNFKEAKKGPVKGEILETLGCERLVNIPSFITDLYKKKEKSVIGVDDYSFATIVIIEGKGKIYTKDNKEMQFFEAGDTFFINAGNKEIVVDGSTEFLVVRMQY